LSASSESQRRTVDADTGEQIPPVTTCRASSGQLHLASGTPEASGGWQASALTAAICTGVKVGGRPDRFASPSDAVPGAAHQRRRHLRTVSTHTPARAAIAVLDSPAAASNTIRARPASACAVRPARTSRCSW